MSYKTYSHAASGVTRIKKDPRSSTWQRYLFKKYFSKRVSLVEVRALVSTDEGKVSSNPAQSGIRNSKCFGSKGFNRCFQNAYVTNNLGYTIL